MQKGSAVVAWAGTCVGDHHAERVAACAITHPLAHILHIMHFLSKHCNHENMSATPQTPAQQMPQSQSASTNSSAEGLLQDSISVQQPVKPMLLHEPIACLQPQ